MTDGGRRGDLNIAAPPAIARQRRAKTMKRDQRARGYRGHVGWIGVVAVGAAERVVIVKPRRHVVPKVPLISRKNCR